MTAAFSGNLGASVAPDVADGAATPAVGRRTGGALGQAPLGEQLGALADLLSRNRTLVEVLARAAAFELPGWYLTAGCLVQTVWNVITGRPAASGIRDYDLFYFDAADLSWEAEDRVIQAAGAAFAGLAAPVEVRNQARVHLWYAGRFGTPCPPFGSTEDAIDHFAAATCCVAVRRRPDGSWHVYAPYGLSDLFNLTVRPNPVLAPRHVYQAKTRRWRRQWPELTVLPWPAV